MKYVVMQEVYTVLDEQKRNIDLRPRRLKLHLKLLADIVQCCVGNADRNPEYILIAGVRNGGAIADVYGSSFVFF